jgi:hypothetical protein
MSGSDSISLLFSALALSYLKPVYNNALLLIHMNQYETWVNHVNQNETELEHIETSVEILKRDWNI